MDRVWRCVAVWLLLAAAGVAASGNGVLDSVRFQNTTETVNGGAEDGIRGNRRALKDLMAGRALPPLGDTVEDCVEAVRRTRQQFNDLYMIVSFPPPDFMPPGAREWCECIVADPPRLDPGPGAETQAEFDRAFDRCRAMVLEGSEINTVDICRGMFDFFGSDLRIYYNSFCGRMCGEDYPLPRLEDSFIPPGLNLYEGCGDDCARETMPGYCAKYPLTYGPWKALTGIRSTIITRKIAVYQTNVGRQSAADFGGASRRANARETCRALQPKINDYNACCSYVRGFGAMQICCSADESGGSFDCDSTFGGKNLVYDCVAGLPYSPTQQDALLKQEYCRSLIQEYIESSEYGSAKLYKQNSTGKVMVMFPDTMDLDCDALDRLDFVANCMDRSGLTFFGPTSVPVTAPVPPADPCRGTCKGDKHCVEQNGRAWCVECTAFMKTTNRGDDLECCRYNESKNRCVSALSNRRPLPGKCKRNQAIFVVDDDSDQVPVSFKKSTGYACANPRDFRANGKACLVRVNSRGRARCWD